MPEQTKFDPEIMKEGWSKVTEAASVTIKDPSALVSFTKEVVSYGATTFKFLGVAENLNDLRKLWRDEAEKKKHSLLGRIGLSIIYAANIAAGAISAAIAVGASVVTAPIAAAVVSGVGLVKNIADYQKESRYLKKLKNESKELADDLAKANVAFEANTALHHDLENSKETIAALDSQSKSLQEMIDELKILPEHEETPEQDNLVATFLAEEVAEAKQALASKGEKNAVLSKNYKSGKHKDETTAENLSRIEEKQKLYQVSKQQLLEQFKTATPADKIELDEKIKIVDAKLNKYAILKPHYEKVQKLESMLQEVKDQQANLDKKYSAEPYKNGTVDKALEAEYLQLRAVELEAKIERKQNPDSRNQKAQKANDSVTQLSGKLSDAKVALLTRLTEQKLKVDNKKEENEKVLNNKSRFVSLFTKDPQKQMQGDAQAVYNKSLALIDNKNQIKLTTLDRNKKAKGIGFAAAGLGLSVCVCVPVLWPVAGILGLVGMGVGVAWGISSLWDRYQKSKVENAIVKEKGVEAKELLSQLDTHMKDKKDKKVAKEAAVTNSLVSRLSDTSSQLTSVNSHDHEVVHTQAPNKGVLPGHSAARQQAATTPLISASEPSVEVSQAAEVSSRSSAKKG